jgi:hypothetical protein
MEVQNKNDLLVLGDRLPLIKNKKLGGFESKEALALQVSYLKGLILKLEAKQLSESLTYICDAKRRERCKRFGFKSLRV